MSWSPSHLVVWPNSTSNAFPVGAITVPSGSVISPVKVPVELVMTVIQSPCRTGSGTVAVDVHVGEYAKHLLHRRRVRFLPVDRFCEAGDVGDHVGVVDPIHRGEVAGVERVVALLHEREQVRSPAGAFGRGCHDGSFLLVGGAGPLGGAAAISLL
jgi:hypothetical protein